MTHPMPDDLPRRLTAWAARYLRWYEGHKTAALLEEAAARILTLENRRGPEEAENERSD